MDESGFIERNSIANDSVSSPDKQEMILDEYEEDDFEVENAAEWSI